MMIKLWVKVFVEVYWEENVYRFEVLKKGWEKKEVKKLNKVLGILDIINYTVISST